MSMLHQRLENPSGDEASYGLPAIHSYRHDSRAADNLQTWQRDLVGKLSRVDVL